MRLLVCVLLYLPVLNAAPAVAVSGIVLDEVAPGSEIEKSGLQVGDVLRRWERLPSPPANPEPARGVLESPFDWMWLERCWLLLRIGEVWGEVGQWEQAHAAFQEAFRWAQSDRTRIFLWEALGKSREYQGRFREAADSYRAGLAIRRATEPDSLGLSRSLHQIASQENNLGNLDAAKEGFDQALALRLRWAPGSFLEADSLQSQGIIANKRSDLESAEYFLKRSVAIQERLDPDSFWMAFKLQSLGDIYALRGDLRARKRAGGEGLLSLTRAFQFAGARSVVASLWQVPDEGSADLMIRFYHHLKNGEAAADALRGAQLEMIAQIPWLRAPRAERRATGLSQDLVWAAFETFGDWQ